MKKSNKMEKGLRIGADIITASASNLITASTLNAITTIGVMGNFKLAMAAVTIGSMMVTKSTDVEIASIKKTINHIRNK